MSAKPDPIRVRCEGSGCPTHRTAAMSGGICSMCGAVIHVSPSGSALDHDRDDVLAMLDRGDFG